MLNIRQFFISQNRDYDADEYWPDARGMRCDLLIPSHVRLMLAALLVLFFHPGCVKAEEPRLGGQIFTELYLRSEAICPLEDGDILYAFSEDPEERPIQADRVLCTDYQGRVKWVQPIQKSLPGWGKFVLLGDRGFGYLFIAASDERFHFVTMDKTGESVVEYILPSNIQTPWVLEDRVYFVSSEGLESMGPDLKASVIELPMFDGISQISSAVSSGGYAYLECNARKGRNAKSKAVVCLNDRDEMVWVYTFPGDYSNWFVLGAIANDRGGVTCTAVFTKEGCDDELRLICLDAEGKVSWERGIAYQNEVPAVSYMRQNPDGDYQLWGYVEETDGEKMTYQLSIDREGGARDVRFHPLWANCFAYIDKEVYATVDPFGLPYIIRYDDLETMDGTAGFTVSP